MTILYARIHSFSRIKPAQEIVKQLSIYFLTDIGFRLHTDGTGLTGFPTECNSCAYLITQDGQNEIP